MHNFGTSLDSQGESLVGFAAWLPQTPGNGINARAASRRVKKQPRPKMPATTGRAAVPIIEGVEPIAPR